MIVPNVVLGKNFKMGEGVVIENWCKIGDNVFIGHHTILREGTAFGTNCMIGHLPVFEG